MKKVFFVSCFLVLINFYVQAQNKYHEDEFKTNPVWINMIDDPNVNYYQAIKAFDLYWEGKTKPMEEDEIKNKKSKENKKEEREKERLKKILGKMKPKEREEYNRLQYQYKRFETWKREVKPFVQEDGRILTEQERINIWNKQQEEIKLQKKSAK
jgi:hypothetical protein